MTKSANTIRQEFIDFFKGKNHLFIKSAPVVPQDDPTLLFTNAGMNQFKSIFLGENKEGWKRVANSQKCMRVSGKHNDLEEVGRDHHHHTFFEMLGNWSFGDYYKKEAITWGWELLTEVWGLDKKRLFVSVHESDDEAAKIWENETDIEPKRVMRFGDKENFWEMGETGPCGPCSEIHYDTADDISDQDEVFADPVKGVNGENDRFREIWNLVFMQYNRAASGELSDLPCKHVDTGMGLERVVSVLQNVKSNYDTDLFRPIITKVEQLAHKEYLSGPAGTPFRVIADHIRALVFAITDGAFPGNEGRGYVLRRLLRRAYRFGRDLGFKGPFLHKLVPAVVSMLGDAFEEITQRADYVSQIILSEEERFDQTLEQGLEKFNQMMERCAAEGESTLSGSDVFTLYDTYGFPMDLTRLMAGEKGLEVDEQGFDAFMEQQRKRARDAQKKGDESGLSADGWVERKAIDGTEFRGYNETEIEAKVARYKVLKPEDAADAAIECLVVLDETPFYAESGGQVGDKGVLVTSSGRELRVVDTFKWNDMIVHKVAVTTSFPVAELSSPVIARINTSERDETRRNHSATHLLQAALREVLGDHVQQSGSRVEPTNFRFDFTHFKSLSTEEIQTVERKVNEWVLADLPVATDLKKADDAKKEGAMALFGEKYGETVRVVSMGRVSKELCGGTHVVSTGRIGLFHITAESSIAAGIRRIEGITGLNSLAYLQKKEDIVNGISQTLKVSEGAVIDRVLEMQSTAKKLEAEIGKLSQVQAGARVTSLFDEANQDGAFPWAAKDLGIVDKKTFAGVTDAISDTIREKNLDTMVVFLSAVVEGKVLLSACAGAKAVRDHGIHCGEIVKTAASKVGGGGGGNPTRAQAGGKDPSKVREALDAVTALLRQKAAS